MEVPGSFTHPPNYWGEYYQKGVDTRNRFPDKVAWPSILRKNSLFGYFWVSGALDKDKLGWVFDPGGEEEAGSMKPHSCISTTALFFIVYVHFTSKHCPTDKSV
ncbi:hypothetical protein JCM33374_g1369 [Metschnikowia sp. JCM 33374]|nr:hypothetical protein JCM33374_g1369 [Metschnikowia sp. JCM 33374]